MNRIGSDMISALILAAGMVGFCVAAEPAVPGSPAQIIVSGHSEVSLPPTTAAFSIGINTRGQSAAAASENNARLSKDVLATLERVGLTRSEIKGSHLSVNRRWEYGSNGQRAKSFSFEATNTIEIQMHQLATVGELIDEALSAGATSASDVTFSADHIDEARHQALAQAVAAAFGDAQALARAGGGMLGELLLLSTERTGETFNGGVQEVVVTAARAMQAAPPPVPTQILPNAITVTANVIGRWRFISSSVVPR